MKYISIPFIVASLFALSLLLDGCDIRTDKQQALRDMHKVEISALLNQMERYKLERGALPPNLEELKKFDIIDFKDIPITDFDYEPGGIIVKDGSRWLLAIPDVDDTNKVLVGKLPVEMSIRDRR